MNIKILGDKVLLKMKPITDEQIGSIFVPSMAAGSLGRNYTIATVVAIGNGNKDPKTSKRVSIPFGVKLGDQVVVAKFIGTLLNIDGADYSIVDRQMLLGVVE